MVTALKGDNSGTVPPTPTGTVTYDIFKYDSHCIHLFPTQQTYPLISGTVHPSGSFNLPQPGTISFKAIYNGDSNYDSIASDCEQIVILPPSIHTAIRNSSNGVDFTGKTVATGTVVHDTVTLTGNNGQALGVVPVGSIDYLRFPTVPEGSKDLCQGTHSDERVLIDSNGDIPSSSPFKVTTPGILQYRVTYNNQYQGPCEIMHIKGR
jgi:hypothetical protein